MTHDQATRPGMVACGCGCGAPVTRRYKPGHDARHKADLAYEAQTPVSAVRRERATRDLLELGWALLVMKPAALAQVTVRSRHRGRFVRTVHIAQARLDGAWLDEAGDTHSHRGCPRIEGEATEADVEAGWACSTCIHTKDHAELALEQARYEADLAADREERYGPEGGVPTAAAPVEEPAEAPAPVAVELGPLALAPTPARSADPTVHNHPASTIHTNQGA